MVLDMVTVADESSVVLRCASSKALRDKALRLYRRRHEKTGVIARFGHGPSAAIAGAAWTDGWMRASGRSTTPGSTAGGGAIPGGSGAICCADDGAEKTGGCFSL